MKLIKNKKFLITVFIFIFLYFLLSFVVAFSAFTIGDQQSDNTPNNVGLSFSEINIKTTNSYISSWWIPSDSDVTLIMLHGLRGQKADDDMLLKIKEFNKLGFSIIAIDFRNHGKSGSGDFTFGVDEVDDVFSTMNYYKEYEGVENFGIWGFSYGATTALLAGSEIYDRTDQINLIGIFAESPYIDLLEVFTDQVAYRTPLNKSVSNFLKPGTVFLTKIFYNFDFNSVEEKFSLINQYEFPVMIISCEMDEIIPSDQIELLNLKFGINSRVENFEFCQSHGEAYISDSVRYLNLVSNFFRS